MNNSLDLSIETGLLNSSIISNDLDDQYYSTLTAKWEDRSICCCKIAYFPEGPFTIINHWRKNLTRPIIIVFIYILTLVVSIYDIIDTFPSSWFYDFALALISILFFNLLISYLMIIFVGPGYVPYNWQVTRKKQYSWTEEMNSIAIYQEQVQYARLSSRPPRASFSIEARRFVLRADHFCLWTNSWIGFKNHRYFILFTFWAFLYCLGWLGSHYYWVLKAFHPYKIQNIISIVFCLPILYAIYFSFLHLFTSLRNLCHNITITEKYKKFDVNRFNKGCFGNCEEVCGHRACCLCWIFPFCPIPRVTDGFYSDYEL